MKTLWLLRHARAGSARGPNSDRQRPLDATGCEAADRIGVHLARRGSPPDLGLCSPALRTCETLDRVLAQLEARPRVLLEDALYLASCDELLERIREVATDVTGLIVVGHNPGIAELAIRLAVGGDEGARSALRRGLPPGGLVELRLASEQWPDLIRGCDLVDFTTP